MFHAEYGMVGKQQINADGSKKYSAGMDKHAAMARLGAAPVDGDTVYVGEGYATCGSIRLALAYSAAVFVCFDTSGLMPVALSVRQLFPHSRIVFCADDDYLTGGTGLAKAQVAAEAVGNASVFMPTFSVARRLAKKDESLPMLTDCNDLHCAEGIEILVAQLAVALPVVSPATSLAVTEVPSDFPAPFLGEPEQVLDVPGEDEIARRYALIYGTTEIWDSKTKRKLKRSAFDAYVGKSAAKTWFDNPKKKMIEKAALPTLIGGAAAEMGSGGNKLNEMLDNLTLSRGTETVWDMIGRQVMTLGAVRADYTPDLTSKWQEHILRKTVEQKNLVFDPTQTVDLKTHVNIFFGWPLTSCENIDLVAPILELIESLCSSEDNVETVFQFMLKWMAYPLQHPGAKMQTALLVFGEKQGTGKSLLFDSILRPIYGEYGTTVGQHQLESGFTDWRSRKLFTLFEEVLSRDDKFSHNGTLKYMITGKRMQVNPKNLPLREENNHMNCVFLSNEPQPIPIELEDRRFLVVQARTLRDKSFYDAVVRSLENGGIEAFYDFLLKLPLGDFNEHTKPPMTRAKERVISFGRSSWDAFHFSWKENILDAPYCSCLTSDLYIVYKRWCDRNGEKPLSLTKFSGYLDSRETKVKKEIALGTKMKKSYMIFEIEDAEQRTLHQQCTDFRDKADVHGLGN
jgi:putative DNA primase/helicase